MRIVLFANTDWYLYNFRLALARALRSDGHDVVLISPPGDWGQRLREEGFDWQPVPLSRRGMNPFREAWMVLHLAKFYRRYQPDLVHHFTIKCVIYGSVAARLAGVHAVVNSITGLGHMLLSASLAARTLRPIVLALYRVALRGTRVIFQNRDNSTLFERLGLLKRASSSHLIQGSGIDLSKFAVTSLPRKQTRIVLAVGRLLWAKGISEVVDAAHIVRQTHSDIEFWIAGERDDGTPDCISQTQIDEWKSAPGIRFLGHRDDIGQLNASASVAVLASREGEGLPRSLLEAAASARPLVATDVPGCRDVVIDGETGFLVPPRDAAAIAKAVCRLLDDHEMAERLGACARRHVETHFSDEHVIRETFAVYGLGIRSDAMVTPQ